MEKRVQKKIKRIVLIGPESTGKTELSKYLADTFHTTYVPEYARYYIENLNRPYAYADVESIALKQIKLEETKEKEANQVLFYDTFLVLTKVWFDVVFKKRPFWIDKRIKSSEIDFFLLCDTQIPWVQDPVRENGGEMREKLFEIYRNELEHYDFNYEIVSGIGDERFKNALNSVNKFLEK